MMNEITPPVSSVTQHCFASDKKETSLAFDALKGEIMIQKNLMLPFAPTSCASFLSQEIPSFNTNNNSALCLCQNTFSSAESKSFGSNSESISKIPSFSSQHGSNSISSLSSTTATPLRTVPFTMIPFEKKNIQKNAEGFQHTQYACVLLPTLVVHTDPNDRIKKLMEAMLENRKFLKKTAQQMYEEEVKNSFFDLLDKKLIDKQEDNYLTLDDSIKSIFRYYKERHSTDWKSMTRRISPIFLSPAILNKSWMIWVKKRAKDQLQFRRVGDLEYDGGRCYDFAQTISQKHVMDLTSKWYKRYLEKIGMKLLNKLLKNGILPHDDGQIYINHAKFNSNLKTTYVYCVLSSKANSFGEFTKIFSNEIDPITPDVGAGLADESCYGESVEAWLGFGDKSSNGKSNLISMY